MYGLIGRITTVSGQRDALIAILTPGGTMAGCRSYIVARDPVNADVLYVTEVWDSSEAHRASLALPAVKEAIAKGRALIAGFETIATTEPIGGIGL